jgi:hypothetical protein
MGQKSVAVHRAYVHVNQTTTRAALAALDGLLGAHTTSLRQLNTGFTPSFSECIDNHELTESSNYRN